MTRRRHAAAEECSHANLEHLGNNRDVRFLRCEDCRTVFVLHSGEAWAIPSPNDVTLNGSEPH